MIEPTGPARASGSSKRAIRSPDENRKPSFIKQNTPLREDGPSGQQLQWTFRIIVIGFVVTVLLFGVATDQLLAQKKKKGEEQKDAPEFTLSVLNFDTGHATDDEAHRDPDETPTGSKRLRELVDLANTLQQNFRFEESKRRPLAIPRDILLTECGQINEGILVAEDKYQANSESLVLVERQLKVMGTGHPNYQGMRSQFLQIQAQMTSTERYVNEARNQLASRISRIAALNDSLKPIEDRMRQLWEEMNSCRQQWLEICVPQVKYARSDFEALKKVLNDWLLIDGLWPQAYYWSALCAFELRDFETASTMIERGEKIREDVLCIPKRPKNVEALYGLIATQSPGQKSKVASYLQAAITGVDRKTDWETHFISARALAENDAMAAKMLSYLDKTLEINPGCQCAKLWRAKLQIFTKNDRVSNKKEGMQSLENLWVRSGKRTWRLAHTLARAYAANGQKAEAEDMMKIAIDLAPGSAQEELEANPVKLN